MKKDDIEYIKNEYREAADKTAIVKILAEQYCCTPLDIIETLSLYGIKYVGPAPKAASYSREEKTRTIESVIMRGVKNHKSNKEMIEELRKAGIECSPEVFSKKKKQIVGVQHFYMKWTDDENAWIEKHYAEDTDGKLARRFQKEMNSERKASTIAARIRDYGKKNHLTKNVDVESSYGKRKKEIPRAELKCLKILNEQFPGKILNLQFSYTTGKGYYFEYRLVDNDTRRLCFIQYDELD